MKRPNLNGGGGAWLRFNARDDAWSARGGEADGMIDPPFRMIIDFENGVTGHERWVNGVVERLVDETPKEFGWKTFWELPVFGDEPLIALGDKPLGVRKFSTSSVLVLQELDQLANEIERQTWQDGVLEIEVQKASAVTTKMGRFFKPTLKIRGWVERSAELTKENAS